MTDDNQDPSFESALREALVAAETREQGIADLRAEIELLAEGVKRVTNGLATATVHSGPRPTKLGAILTMRFDFERTDPEDETPRPQLVLLVESREGEIPWEMTRELCRVTASAAAYPFRIDGPLGTLFGEDREGLHRALVSVFSHPRTGIKIKGLLNDVREKKSLPQTSSDGESR